MRSMDTPTEVLPTVSLYSPMKHMVTKLGSLLGDLRANTPLQCCIWLVATTRYQAYNIRGPG